MNTKTGLALLACVICLLTATVISANAEETTIHTVKSKQLSVTLSDKGEIVSIGFGDNRMWTVQMIVADIIVRIITGGVVEHQQLIDIVTPNVVSLAGRSTGCIVKFCCAKNPQHGCYDTATRGTHLSHPMPNYYCACQKPQQYTYNCQRHCP